MHWCTNAQMYRCLSTSDRHLSVLMMYVCWTWVARDTITSPHWRFAHVSSVVPQRIVMTVCICGCLDVCMAVYLSAGKHLQTARVYVCLSGTLSVCLSVSLSILTDNVGIYVCVAHIHSRIHLVCVCVCVCLQFYIISGRLYITSIFRNARYTHTHKHTSTHTHMHLKKV